MKKHVPSKLVISFIVANEFCERYCFYGFRALLYIFLRQSYNLSEETSIKTFHFFNFSCYFFTFIGGVLSDSLFGRYKTILYLSTIYLFGTILTSFSSFWPSFIVLAGGLGLISVGTGGIKPCVSTFGGDQYDESDIEGIKSFFNIFYFSINAGSLLSIFLSPIISEMHCLNKNTCYPLAFGIPSILLGISLILFLAGNKMYVKKEPDSRFFSKVFKCIMIYLFDRRIISEKNIEVMYFEGVDTNHNSSTENIEKNGFWIKMVNVFGTVFAEEMARALEIMKVFALVPFFWMMYDQQSTTWVEQASNMKTGINLYFASFSLIPSQMQAFNGILILIFIPFFTKIVYPFIIGKGYAFNSLTKMFFGMVFASLSFFIAAIIEKNIDNEIHILWQVPQYIFLTVGEILLSMTGMEFVYSQAPESMKGLILSAWLLTVATGNLYVIIFTSLDFLKWLNIGNIRVWNYIVYGCIGLIASLYFYKHSKSFHFRT